MSQRLLRREEVMDRLGIRRTTLVKMVETGELPPPVKVTGTVRCWPEDDITAFINARIAADRPDAQPQKD